MKSKDEEEGRKDKGAFAGEIQVQHITNKNSLYKHK